MRHIGILIQRGCRSILHPTKGLMLYGEDWTLILDSYLFLKLELLHEAWIQRLLNQDHRRPLCVLNSF